jgi:hypothetical protein
MVQNDMAINIIHVDDGCLIGKQATIDQVLDELSTCFTVKKLGPLKKYVGCVFEEMSGKVVIKQPKLLSALSKKFAQFLDDRECNTPAAPCLVIMRPSQDDMLVSDEKQKDF